MGIDGPRVGLRPETSLETFEGPLDPRAYPVSVGAWRTDVWFVKYNILDPEGVATGYSSPECPSRANSQKERGDFDDGANSLWSLYGKVAKTHDEARFSSWAEDMDSVGVFVRV